ncbi:coenzyme F420-0:L-glutamate ligase [Methylobacterium organophilum]|uniref:Bifunctional F420 biosynthesis protein FbiB n=1 Tax=Methylobacterium organophilum TaxID=410 RepID=A0ABQ4TI13_METOR|nr:coenzyme F420-0:L-glutamate ligase [Methylobacterium organophilum]GJE29647.1 Bifunctional F420 biosynthesis protein FbiB [Methylobacterium organophilum]
MRVQTPLTLTPLPGLPLVRPGDDLMGLLIAAIDRAGLVPGPRAVLVVAQKVVSKAEGRFVDLADVVPSARARDIAAMVDKDPRLVEVILSESDEVVATRRGALIVAHRLGFVMANAGVDQSNVGTPEDGDRVLLLPEDPDGWCTRAREALSARYGRDDLAVVMADSFGRAWRHGTVGVALGAAGLPALIDCIGTPDLFGRALRVTQIGFADEIAAAASLLMGQAAEGVPAVLVQGLSWQHPSMPAAALLRDKAGDLFR